jgi:hypothetical protein
MIYHNSGSYYQHFYLNWRYILNEKWISLQRIIIHFIVFFAYHNIYYFNHELFTEYGEIQLIHEQKSEVAPISLWSFDYYELKTFMVIRFTFYQKLNCSTFIELFAISLRVIKRLNYIFSSVLTFLVSSNCDFDTYMYGFLFLLELFFCWKVPNSCISFNLSSKSNIISCHQNLFNNIP